MKGTLRSPLVALAVVGAAALGSLALVTAAQVLEQASGPARIPSDSEIRKLLAERIDTYRQGVGIVVGLIEPQGRRIVSYGTLDQADPRPVTSDTVFEIGSITKVFTSLVFADMVRRGEVALNDPVIKYLPRGVKVPERNGRQITLVDLATHTSALPREALNFEPTPSLVHMYFSALRAVMASACDLKSVVVASALHVSSGPTTMFHALRRMPALAGMRSSAMLPWSPLRLTWLAFAPVPSMSKP